MMDLAITPRAWLFTSSDISLAPVSAPPLVEWTLEQGEVVVALLSACICGSDLHTVSGKRTDPAAPLILGHEGVGSVVATARADVRVGDVVTWALATPQCDGTCAACSRHLLPQKCSRVFKYGHAPWPRGESPHAPRAIAEGMSGCLASHALLRRDTPLVRLEPAVAAGVPRAALASANCAAATAVACWRAAERHLAASSRGTWAAAVGGEGARAPRVLVFGAGLLGLYTAGAAARGPSPAALICVVDVSPERLALALRFGATHAALVPGGTPPEEAARLILAACGGEGDFDAVLEVCGAAEVITPGLRLVRPGGVLVLAGVVHPASALGAISGEAIIRKCAALVGVHNYAAADLEEAVALICALHAADVPWDALFSPPQRLDALPAALALAATGAWARVVVEP